jgi:hypothetical protein
MWTAEEIKRFNRNLERVATAMEELTELLKEQKENKETN